MAAVQIGDWQVYESFPELLGDGSIDLDNDTFLALLLVSHTADVENDDLLADVSGDEHASENGYSRVTLTNVTWSRTGATTVLNCDPIVFEADGGSIVASHLLIVDDSGTGDPLVAIAEFQDANGDPDNLTIADGNSLTYTPDPTTGIVRLVVV